MKFTTKKMESWKRKTLENEAREMISDIRRINKTWLSYELCIRDIMKRLDEFEKTMNETLSD